MHRNQTRRSCRQNSNTSRSKRSNNQRHIRRKSTNVILMRRKKPWRTRTRRARGQDVGRLVIGSSLVLIFSGVVLGILGAWGATRALAGLLYGVEPTDPLTFAAVIVVLLLAGILAAILPASRASRIDPVQVLAGD